MKTTVIPLIVLCIFWTTVSCSKSPPKLDPQAVKTSVLYVHYIAGYSPYRSWTTEIDLKTGKVKQRIYDLSKFDKLFHLASEIVDKNGLLYGSRTEGIPYDEKEMSPLSKQQLHQLISAIEDSNFFHLGQQPSSFWGQESLNKRYTSGVSDASTEILEIRHGRLTASVEVYGIHILGDHPDVRRFAAIWRTVLSLVPSPNPDQTPEMYSDEALDRFLENQRKMREWEPSQ